ncbi:hypothetical protein HYFRA_00002380 [Hymenoscyphus fraxineus]|uniref:C2 domain-containing protein n=1 Tax=Hymenoscyphus fraxineus TaxID=746836 RepID=A0A9N9LA67_9HELO|nr:hypothetical protein HYFRA_00002380 [Hymenoscyphus fraxineus]
MSQEKLAPPPETNGAVDDTNHAPTGITEKEEKPQHGKVGATKEKLSNKQEKLKDEKHPAGGYDKTPIPPARDGYTVKFTFHRAENLPVADLNTRSSDPYIHATLTSALQKRHKEDPDLVLRTPTIHKNTDPEWNTQWIVGGVPSSGFRLKCRIYDEDPSDHDDRLGNVTISVGRIGLDWQGIHEEQFDIKKRMGSKRAYSLRACSVLLNSVNMSGHLYLSAEIIGETEPPHGRMYTIGETSWVKHFSPMIGRLTGTKAPGSDEAGGESKTQRYDFQANQFQLQGPVPSELYHRFVEFKPFVKGMFSKAGVRGRILNRALHHQHASVYNFSNSTEYGVVKPRSEEASLQFLKMVHFDEGGRIFTYVLTLDGLLRFTETGKEFGIDLLSKHTMHSDVNVYIACSGEFFVRRLKHPKRPAEDPSQETHPDADLKGGPPHTDPPKDPKNYELVIDNDSGTYRPEGSLLPLLKEFLNLNFPGLHVVTKECTDEKLEKWKEGQREKKKAEGKNITMVQNSDDEISSSDEEGLEDHINTKKSGKEKLFHALENPKEAAREMMPGGHHKEGNGEGSRA